MVLETMCSQFESGVRYKHWYRLVVGRGALNPETEVRILVPVHGLLWPGCGVIGSISACEVEGSDSSSGFLTTEDT